MFTSKTMWQKQLGLKVGLLPKVLTRHFSFNTKWKENEYIGTEFEVEGYNLPVSLTYYWDVKVDDSLRRPPGPGGTAYEYVAKKPVSTEFFKKKTLPYLRKHLTSGGSEPKFSLRCSTHVHVGVHQLYFYQVFLLAGLYHIIEDTLWPLLGENREGFLFCVGASTSRHIPLALVEAVNGNGFTSVFQYECFKYTSLNLRTLHNLGTVEFRGMEGTLDVDRLSIWIDLLNNIRTYAASIKPEDAGGVLNIMSANGPLEFFKDLVGAEPYKHILKLHGGDIQKLEQLLYEGINNMQPLFYEPDWSKIERVDELPSDLSPFTERKKPLPRTLRKPSEIPTSLWSTLLQNNPSQAQALYDQAFGSGNSATISPGSGFSHELPTDNWTTSSSSIEE